MSDRLLQKQSENEGQRVDAVSKEILAVVNREAKQAREHYLQLSNDLWAVRAEMSKKIEQLQDQTKQFNSSSVSQAQTPESETKTAPAVASYSNEPKRASTAYWPEIKES